MKAYSEFLSEREIYILENHPAMSYRAIGEKFGIGQERVRQIKVAALRKVRQEKLREQAAERNKLPVTLNIRRKDLFIIIRSLDAHLRNIQQYRADQRLKDPEKKSDPDYDRAMELRDLFRKALGDEGVLDELMTESSSSPAEEKIIPLRPEQKDI